MNLVYSYDFNSLKFSYTSSPFDVALQQLAVIVEKV